MPLQPFVLILDEVQKVPRWSEAVKALWDQRPKGRAQPIHLVLLGSSQFLVQHGLTESLAGRFELIRLPHWSFSEMREAFGFRFEDYICFGGYPGPASLIQTPERWIRYLQDAIVEPAISCDVMNLARIDKPALMRSLMQLGCAYSSQVLSYQKVMGQLQDAGNTTTLANYLHLLVSAWMVTGPSAARDHPETWGRLVESAVGPHLLNTASPGMQITYFRDITALPNV